VLLDPPVPPLPARFQRPAQQGSKTQIEVTASDWLLL
jgi:hypothetical protein